MVKPKPTYNVPTEGVPITVKVESKIVPTKVGKTPSKVVEVLVCEVDKVYVPVLPEVPEIWLKIVQFTKPDPFVAVIVILTARDPFVIVLTVKVVPETEPVNDVFNDPLIDVEFTVCEMLTV